VVLNGLAGAAGLLPTLRALEAGTALALANKESLIIGGPLVRERARPGQIRPVDSEHSALAQCLMGGTDAEVSRLILTASGGPFRGWSRERLSTVTPEQALAHPTWTMGPLVTVNSSTLVNKGLEVIEAHLLFDIPLERIDVVVHPQSVVHSMVEFIDGSTLAQASPPDMRLPIGYALAYPYRIGTPFGRIDWGRLGRLDFEQPDTATFRCLPLAYEAGRVGSTAPAWLSAANEVAVEAFLAGRVRWPHIAEICDAVLQRYEVGPDVTVDDVIAADARARLVAATVIADTFSV
jgi:1-deoxy-D-xylulose-5-phosphate reductoisomerase